MCNLKELTTKSTSSTHSQRSVWKRMYSSVAFRSCGICLAVHGVLSASVAESSRHLALPPPFPFFVVFLFLSSSTHSQRSVWKRMYSSVAFRSCGICLAVHGVLSASVAESSRHLALPPPFPFFVVFLFLSTDFSV